jgi:transposase
MLFEKQSRNINKMIVDGKSVMDISKDLDVSYHCVQSRIAKSMINIDTTKVELGHKDAPYYDTEEEMLIEKKYNYENLSNEEREIYDQREADGSLGSYFASNDGLYGGC